MMPFSSSRMLGSMFLGFLLPALLMTGAAFAAERVKVALPQTRPLLWECVIDAAHKNDLPLAALVGILTAEGGEPGEALSNANGTWDMGPFQINTCHVNELVDMGIAPETVLRDGCANAYAAAWLLRKEYKRTGNLWEAVGAYHSRTPKYRDAYIARVKEHLARLERMGLSSLPYGGRHYESQR